MSDPCPFCGASKIIPTRFAGVLECSFCKVGFGPTEGAPLRVRCLVPGCNHTRGDRKGDPIRPGMEWICAEHWRPVSRRLKAIRSRALRRLKRAETVLPAVELAGAWTSIHETARRADAAQWRLWKRIKREAIERAMGIS